MFYVEQPPSAVSSHDSRGRLSHIIPPSFNLLPYSAKASGGTGIMLEQFDLEGRVALVTGGSKGLGAAMARALAQAGASVIVNSRKSDELKAALPAILEGTRARGAWIAADVSDRADVARLAHEALGTFGKVDILVNNAGTNIIAPIDRVADSDWDQVLALNLTGPMALSRALVPGMKERRWGRIIHVSSVFGLVSRAERNAYSATKAGLVGLTHSMALDLAPHGVTVNAILPGPFETPLTAAMHPDPAKKQWFTDRVPMGRWGRPEELAGPLLLLASPAGSYITGTCLAVDGGWLAQ
jgi:NAD(P)-dependent dehydrogenase (short-subunit alcohol dehydrogenase family)